MIRTCCKFASDQTVRGQQHPASSLVGLRDDVLGGVKIVRFLQRGPKVCPEGCKECVGHAAPNHQNIQSINEVFQKFDLGRYFRPAHHGTNWALRVGQRFF